MRKLYLFTLLLLTAVGCTRRPLSQTGCSQSSDVESAEIAVSVDWSTTGYDITSDEEYIHRVSFRFFPLDGSTPFDRYLEGDVESGVIEVPVGSYSIVIFNESIYDTYWQNAILFENVDSYELFAATIVDEDRELYDFFYIPDDDEALSVEALALASCSVDYFEVTESMASLEQEQWGEEEQLMATRLNPVVPRRLTCYTTIGAVMENLSSAYTVHASLTGLAQRVFMATGEEDSLTTTHIWELSEREWDDESEQQHGTISQSRLTFSTPATEDHILTLDVLLIDGSRHDPEEELIYDVTDQIISSTTRYADSDLGASVSLSLPVVTGDISVEGWGEETKVTLE